MFLKVMEVGLILNFGISKVEIKRKVKNFKDRLTRSRHPVDPVNPVKKSPL